MIDRKLTWKPDVPNIHDRWMPESVFRGVLPVYVSLEGKMPPVYDQGPLGYCVEHGIAAAVETDELDEGLPVCTPSRLFIGWNAHVEEGTQGIDCGTSISTGIRTLNDYGYCSEDLWPYEVSQFAIKPPDKAFQAAELSRDVVSARVQQTELALKGILAAGRPVVFGFSVYQGFMGPEMAATGIALMPKPFERARGGHCAALVGYDDDRKAWYCRNSWGTSWGIGGYFWMPFEYLLHNDLAADFWVIERVSASRSTS